MDNIVEITGLVHRYGRTTALAGVTEVDSAAVSLLLEWRRAAAKAQREIEFANLPPALTSLAELYGVLDLIGDR